MRLWSTSCRLTLACLLVSSILLIEKQRFIRERTRRTKKVAWSSTFLWKIFSAYADFFWRSSWLCACLKVESYTEAEKSACWKPALSINCATILESLNNYFRLKKRRSSRPEVFCKKVVLRNFRKFTGKHLCQSLFLNKVAVHTEHLWRLLLKMGILRTTRLRQNLLNFYIKSV